MIRIWWRKKSHGSKSQKFIQHIQHRVFNSRRAVRPNILLGLLQVGSGIWRNSSAWVELCNPKFMVLVMNNKLLYDWANASFLLFNRTCFQIARRTATLNDATWLQYNFVRPLDISDLGMQQVVSLCLKSTCSVPLCCRFQLDISKRPRQFFLHA